MIIRVSVPYEILLRPLAGHIANFVLSCLKMTENEVLINIFLLNFKKKKEPNHT